MPLTKLQYPGSHMVKGRSNSQKSALPTYPDIPNISFTYSCFWLPWLLFPWLDSQSSYWTIRVVMWVSCSILSLGQTLSLVGCGIDLVIQQVCCLKHYPEHINTNKWLTCPQAWLSQWTIKGVPWKDLQPAHLGGAKLNSSRCPDQLVFKLERVP